MNITVNEAEQRFVISAGSCCSVLGFDVVFEQAKELAARLLKAGRDALLPKQEDIGTLAQYDQYRSLLDAYRTLNDKTTWFDARTPVPVQKALERYRLTGKRVRLFMGDPVSGRDWMSEHDVVGWVGRSMGPMKSPLLVVSAADAGGSALLTHCIVRMVDVLTNREVYCHPTYHLPRMELTECESYDRELGFTHSVKVETGGVLETRVNFKSMYDAAHWISFMAGKSHELS